MICTLQQFNLLHLVDRWQNKQKRINQIGRNVVEISNCEVFSTAYRMHLPAASSIIGITNLYILRNQNVAVNRLKQSTDKVSIQSNDYNKRRSI